MLEQDRIPKSGRDLRAHQPEQLKFLPCEGAGPGLTRLQQSHQLFSSKQRDPEIAGDARQVLGGRGRARRPDPQARLAIDWPSSTG